MRDFAEEKNHIVNNKKDEILDDIQVKKIEEEFEIDLEGRSPEEIECLVKMEMAMEERFSGPIPHPRILKGYEEILPGSADRILTMAENQSKHRQAIEAEVVHSN